MAAQSNVYDSQWFFLRSGVGGGNPTSAGTTDPNGVFMLGNANVHCRFGLYASGAIWVQPSSAANYGTAFGLALLPVAGALGIGQAPGTDKVEITGNLALKAAGNGLKVKEGTNARMGTATLVAGTVTIANTSVTANTRIFLSRTTTGGTAGHLSSTRIANTSFTINSSSGTDTSTVDWLLVEPS